MAHDLRRGDSSSRSSPADQRQEFPAVAVVIVAVVVVANVDDAAAANAAAVDGHAGRLHQTKEGLVLAAAFVQRFARLLRRRFESHRAVVALCCERMTNTHTKIVS